MSKNNGFTHPDPPFAVFGATFAVMPRSGVIETLEKNAIAQTKGNLALGPIFRELADSFRGWSMVAEPGCAMQLPEINLFIVRLVGCAPLAQALSKAAQERAAQPEPPTDGPRLILRQ
jgi:hypothetical protein